MRLSGMGSTAGEVAADKDEVEVDESDEILKLVTSSLYRGLFSLAPRLQRAAHAKHGMVAALHML